MLSGKSVNAVRDAQGKIIQAAEFQSTEALPGRIQPDRRWFGNTRTISQTALEHFRTSLKEKIADPYSVVLKRNKLPMSLLSDAVSGKQTMDLTTTEPFSDTFGKKAQRKRPKLEVGSIGELAAQIESARNKKREAAVVAAQDKQIELLYDAEDSVNPEDSKAQAENDALGDRPMDYILSAGTSRRIWSELYKVIDSSDLLLHVLDARDPIGTRCDSVEAYLAKEKRGKKIVYILNKVDLVPGWVAARWVKILSKTHPTIAFHASINNSFGKGSLIQLLRQFSTLFSDKKQISVGFIGYPNVGKSSIINTLKKKAVCKTAPIPGETKVWQYITLMRRIYLIDCPGIVPPSARDSESQKVLKGVVRVEHLSSPSEHISFLLERVRPEYITRTYGIEGWTSDEDFLAKLAAKMGKLHRGGEADHRTVATMVLNDWIRGKIPYFVAPPEPDNRDANGKPLPRPLKVSAEASTSKPKKGKQTGGTDELGNEVKSIKGVTQPLHQIVHSSKFMEDDDRKIEDDSEPEAEADEVEEDEWEGIGSDDEGEEEDDDELDEASFEEGDDNEAPLEWDELFAQAVGEAEGSDAGSGSDSGSDSDAAVASSLAAGAKGKLSAKAEGKKRAVAEVSSEEDDEAAKPAKEKRVTTNKKKATNFFTTANVKNKNRNKVAPDMNGRQGKGKGTGKGRRGQKSSIAK